jgi:hypothetical protein
MLILFNNKITASAKKISIWKQKGVNRNTDMFPWTNYFNEENNFVLGVTKNVFLSHLTTLVTYRLKNIFQPIGYCKTWIRQLLNVPSEKT